MSERPEIPNFTITDFCGRGASSEVWIGIDADNVRRAIKIMDLADPGKAHSIEQENNAIAAYRAVVNRSGFLLDILYIGRTDRYLYYVTELADNASKLPNRYEPDTLSERLKTRKFSTTEIIGTISEICEGVAFLHSNALAHCDLKPANILYIDNTLRIADPGLLCSATQATRSGTDGFIPPWPSTAIQNDIYAIGKILYCLYSGCDATEYPSLPPGSKFDRLRKFNEITMRCCDDNPAIRFQSISELLDAVRLLQEKTLMQKISERKMLASMILLAVFSIASAILNCHYHQLLYGEQLSDDEAAAKFRLAQELVSKNEILQAYHIMGDLERNYLPIRENTEFQYLYRSVRQRYLWLQCFNWNDMNGTDLLLPFSESSFLSTPDKLDLFRSLLRSNQGNRKSVVFLFQYLALLYKSPDSQPEIERVFEYLDLIEATPENTALLQIYLTRMTDLCMANNDLARARLLADRACALDGGSHLGFVVRAALAIREKRYREAINDLQRTLELRPGNQYAAKLLKQIPRDAFDKY